MTQANHPQPDTVAELTLLLSEAKSAGASDVHLQSIPEGLEIGFRLDGILQRIRRLHGESSQRLLGRIKYLARLKTYVDALPQEGRISRPDSGVDTEIRVATYPTVTGEKIVLRLFRDRSAPVLEELDLEPPMLETLKGSLGKPSGLILFTGPAGSGKTTTTYAAMRHLLGLGDRHIISIEDPVECILEGVMQTEISEVRGLTFAVALRHLLRQDPQVLALGEIRDEETAAMAVRAGLTGHLIISTLHAGSTPGVVERLLDLCPDRHSVASSLLLVSNQRLLRRLCPVCEGDGCDACSRTGYRGRVPIVEWLGFGDVQRTAVRSGDIGALKPACTLLASAESRIAQGMTDRRELQRVLGP